MDQHLDYVVSELSRRQMPSSAEWIGTMWNNLRADEVSDYGRRVDGYFKRFASVGVASLEERSVPSLEEPRMESKPDPIRAEPPSQTVSNVRTPSAGTLLGSVQVCLSPCRGIGQSHQSPIVGAAH